MAVETPNSFKDPFWTDLASSAEQKAGLPKGLLVAVLTRGERSNADQVSEAGAKTPFQIIPSTRKAAIDKYGIDPYLSPENSAEVAAKLLKDSLDRNGGNAPAAVAEYHGGTDRSNWGPRTRAYVQRVTGTQPTASPVRDASPSVSITLPASDGQSTFDRVAASMGFGKPPASAMASVFQAYQDGQMTAEETKQFEQDVNAGRVMLPRGAQLKGAAPAQTGPQMLPVEVADAYRLGKMSPQEKTELEADVRAGLVKLPQSGTDFIPGNDGSTTDPNAAIIAAGNRPPPPTLVDKAIGAGEAGLTALTGATTGMIGGAAGFASGVKDAIQTGQTVGPNGEDLILQSAGQGAQALTYQPRTQSGQDQAQIVGEIAQNLLPAAAVLPGIPGGASAARAATPTNVLARAGAEGIARDLGNVIRPVAGDAAATAVAKTLNGASRVSELASKVTTLPRRAIDALRSSPEEAAPTPGTKGSAGAAGTDMATQRIENAQSMEPPLQLTKGQATRDPAQLKFEVETAKLPEEGGRLRERYVEQNDALLRNFDNMVDQTGAEAPTLRAVGQSVDQALVNQFKNDKAKVRAAYKAADQAGEMSSPVQLDALIDHLNQVAPEAPTAPLINTARNLAVKLGIAEEQNGVLVQKQAKPQPYSSLMNSQPDSGITLKRAELFRQAINRNTDFEPTNIRQATIMKGLIDEATAGKGGDLYQQARALRTRLAQNYEDRAVIAKLLNNKRGMADRQVALEDIFDHTIQKGSLDDIRNVRRVLHRSGGDGAQAWRELQGQTVRWLRDQATKNVATDASGARVLSPAALDRAVRSLDHDGKLDFIFGKRGAQRLRDINDLAQYVKTVPPEAAINTSNTAATLLSAFADVGISGITGTPAPVATGARLVLKHIKDVKLRNRISDALNDVEKRAPGRKNPPLTAPNKQTFH